MYQMTASAVVRYRTFVTIMFIGIHVGKRLTLAFGSSSSRLTSITIQHYANISSAKSRDLTQRVYRRDAINGNSHVRLFASNILVCGDGDLSYAAAIAPTFDPAEVRLLATVLESQVHHESTYEKSVSNAREIIAAGHEVQYEVDATRLQEKFGFDTKFDAIRFNFPHWRGKANNRYNRELLENFFASAETVLTDHGAVEVVLFEHQSGIEADSLEKYRSSWLAPQLAAEAGLLLKRKDSFELNYQRSSYRGVDKAFFGKEPELSIYVKPTNQNVQVPLELQLCCRHELHINLPKGNYEHESDVNQSIDRTTLHEAITSHLPPGIECDVLFSEILLPDKTGLQEDIAIYMIIYRGASIPITQASADIYRSNTEQIISKMYDLRKNKMGRTISRPIPYITWQKMVEERSKESEIVQTGLNLVKT